MASDDPYHHRSALEYLCSAEQPPDEATITWLIQRLEDSEPDVRRLALDALGRVAHRWSIHLPIAVVQQVLTASEAPEKAVRLQACTALALLPGTFEDLGHRVGALTARLSDPHREIQAQAAAAIGDLSKMQAPIPPAAIAILSEWVDQPGAHGFEAAYALAMDHHGHGIKRLEQSLGDPRLQTLALEGIGRVRAPESLPILRRYAKRWFIQWSDRFLAWAVMAHIGDDVGEEAIVQRLRARRFEERLFACALIGEWQLAQGRTELVSLIHRATGITQEAAIEALGKIGHPEDQRVLETLARDANLRPDTRQVAQKALEDLLRPTA